MIDFIQRDDKLLFLYQPENSEPNWVIARIKEDGNVLIKKTFNFKQQHVVEKADHNEPSAEIQLDFDIESEAIYFLFAELADNYYKVCQGILVDEFDIFIHENVSLKPSYFVADANASVFRAISMISNRDFYLGGDNINAIPIEDFEKLIKYFPTPYERKRYVEARIASILRNYLDNVKDAERSYEKYLNKKISKQGADLVKTFKDIDLFKYETIYEKLKAMLKTEEQYNERQWQQEILQIILLLYPKYIHVFKEVPIKARIAGDIRERYLDFLLVDSNGNVDIVEIKRPFENAIMTGTYHRNNYIPLRELSGTVMQIEKYVYYLNRWSEDGEKYLNEKYRDILPENFDIKITNPSGIIIMGRENNLLEDQKRDFEVVKRKYKNVVDIITYDNLLERLRFTIEQIKKQ